MARLKIFVIFAILYSCSELGHGEFTTPKTVLIDVPPQHPVEASSTERTTSPAEVVTTETAPPSTTSSTTTSTTTTPPPPPPPPPTPSPTPAPAPAPAPGPVPAPDQGTWHYTDASNNTCIVVQFAAQLDVKYPQGINNTLTDVLVNVPANATVTDGSCNTTEQWIELQWGITAGNVTYNNTLKLVFAANDTSKTYIFKGLNVSLVPQIFYNSTINSTVDVWHGEDWQTPLATSYRCSRSTELKLTGETSNVAASITFTKLQEEAFRNATNTSFSAARECGGGDVPDAVPIAVGCALGGLVVVVLVAYLVARRRSAARGYLSM